MARQIGQHGLGPAEGPLGVDNPFGRPQWRERSREGSRIVEVGVSAEKLQRPLGMSALPPLLKHDRTSVQPILDCCLDIHILVQSPIR